LIERERERERESLRGLDVFELYADLRGCAIYQQYADIDALSGDKTAYKLI
jgi:hypothetical protein